jgi:hypothetical protein
MEWVAYCTVCIKVLDSAKNGQLVEAAAQRHTNDMDHLVIVGYFMSKKEKQCDPNLTLK